MILITLSSLCSLWGQSSTSLTMELYNTAYRGEDEWYYAGTGTAALEVKSPRDPNVQGALVVEFMPLDLADSSYSFSASTVNVKKAYIKARFPGMKMTLGKTRLAWGDGIVFNAGDILFGSLNPLLDLTSQELRSDTAWLTAVNIPLGRFAFLEGVLLPPGLDVSDPENPGAGDFSRASGGGRTYFTLLNTKVEIGYLYKGEEKVDIDVIGHRPYFSLQGNIGPDWYMASSAAFLTDWQRSEGSDAEWEDSWNISFGLFHLQEINRNNTLNLRLESLCFPFQNWEEQGGRDSIYGLYLYPELTWLQGGSLTWTLRSVLSPLDASAMITAGAGWNIYQGLILQAYASFFSGDPSDTFAWDRGEGWDDEQDLVNGVSIMAGARYTY